MTPRILVVDDEIGLCAVLKDLLEIEGYAVAACQDPISALDMLSVRRFDAALLDVFMEGHPVGLDLALYIMDECPKTKIILMTGYADRVDIMDACSSGVFACIDKPFNLDDVLRVVETALHREVSMADSA